MTPSSTLLAINRVSPEPSPLAREDEDTYSVSFTDVETQGFLEINIPGGDPPPRLIISNPDNDAVSALDPITVRTGVIDITPETPLESGTFVAKICLEYKIENPAERVADMCLAFYDRATDSWICQDRSVRRESNSFGILFLCGFTNHFTNFAVLLVGAQNGNGSSDDQLYFTGDWRGDVSVAGGIALIILIVGAIIISVATIRKKYENKKLRDELSSGSSSRRSFRNSKSSINMNSYSSSNL